MYWTDSSGRIELSILASDAAMASHAGQCDDDVEALRQKPSVRRQLAKLSPKDVASALREYGAWDDEELEDHDANLSRLLWIACGDIREQA